MSSILIPRSELIVPERFNGSTSRIKYVNTGPLNIGKLTVMYCARRLGAGEAGFHAMATTIANSSNDDGWRTFWIDGGAGQDIVQVGMDSGTDDAPSKNSNYHGYWGSGYVVYTAVTFDDTNITDFNAAISIYLGRQGVPMYKDGRTDSGANGSGSLSTSSTILTLGDKPGSLRSANADIYYWLIWNRILDLSEMQEVQLKNPLAIQDGLIFARINGKQWQKHHFAQAETVDIKWGVPADTNAVPKLKLPSKLIYFPVTNKVSHVESINLPYYTPVMGKRGDEGNLSYIAKFSPHMGQQINTAQTIFVQTWPVKNTLATLGYFYTNTDAAAVYGIIIGHRVTNGAIRFNADSTGIGQSPTREGGSITFGCINNIAAIWDGTLNYTGINIYTSINAETLKEVSSYSVNTSGTGAVRTFTKNPIIIGNRVDGNRPYDGGIYHVARWNRILSLTELNIVRLYGPQSIPNGLIFHFANMRDLGPYNLSLEGQDSNWYALDFTPYSTFVPPVKGTRRVPLYYETDPVTGTKRRSRIFMIGL